MRLFKIRNRYMYTSSNRNYDPNGVHTYAVYKDKTSGKYHAIQLTHLYEPKKVAQIENGRLMVEKFSNFRYPTGVKNNYYDKDINGNDLYFGRNARHRFVGNVSNSQATRIKAFAKRRHR